MTRYAIEPSKPCSDGIGRHLPVLKRGDDPLLWLQRARDMRRGDRVRHVLSEAEEAVLCEQIAAALNQQQAAGAMLTALRLAKRVRENPNRTVGDHAAVGKALHAAITAAEAAGITANS